MSTKIKYVIVDFGNVIAGPKTGAWYFVPKFFDYVDKTKINEKKLIEALEDKFLYILYKPVRTLKEEYDMFVEYYEKSLKYSGYSDVSREIVGKIAYDRVCTRDNYMYYPHVKEELKQIASKYKLILLSDNWPSVIQTMKDEGIYDYFTKIYVSSICGVVKSQKLFFDYPINDFDIKPGEAIFIDDMEGLVDIGKEKKMNVAIMSRDNLALKSKHYVIQDFRSIINDNDLEEIVKDNQLK